MVVHAWRIKRRLKHLRLPTGRRSHERRYRRHASAKPASASASYPSSARASVGRTPAKRARYHKPLRMNDLFHRAAVVLVFFLLLLGFRQLLASGEKIRVPAETVAAFRVPYRSIGMLKAYSAKRGVPFGEMFALFCAENGFFPEKAVAYDLSVLDTQYVQDYKQIKRKYSAGSIAPYADMFTGLFDEIECFPIPTGFAGEDNPEESPAYIYGDSWGVTRNYEGDKHHMGTDILDRENIRGRLGVVSMTDGQVHDAGWREPLGYYVGVETTNGNYYLYAHLDTLAEDIAAGMPVSAGQGLGRMGNTGDSRSSDGAFQVHLHVAISPQAGFTKNKFWINPYPLLRYIEDNSILA